MDVKIIEAEIAIFAYIGVFFQDNKAPNKFPIKKYNTNEIDINPIDQGSARPTISLTGVGNIASETPKSNETKPPK